MKGDTYRKTISKIATVVLIAGVILTSFQPPQPVFASTVFSDTNGHWAQKYITEAVELGIVTGYQNGTFSPDKKVTRAEFACMINRALGNLSEAEISFSDVNQSDWFYEDVAKAVAAAYSVGDSSGKFNPKKVISRQEAAVMISKVVPTYAESTNMKAFSDYKTVSDWSYKAMSKVIGKGYMSGYSDGKLHPLDSLTRAQAVTMITELLDEETIVDSEYTISKDNAKVSGKIYANGIEISKDLDEGSATIDNCIVLGELNVKGGGDGTVTLNNTHVATMNVAKSGTPVRVLAKGETTIAVTNASKESTLQATGIDGGPFGAGFEKLNLLGSSIATLRGSFPYVSIAGSGVELNFETGYLDLLTVTSAGKQASITLDSDTTIEKALVSAQADFYGDGDIDKMYIYAQDVTYETKPASVVIGTGGETPSSGSDVSGLTISPEKGATDVYLDSPIVITFDSKMTNPKGKALAASKIKSIVTLNEKTADGTSIKFSATISEDTKVFTITPEADLEAETKYYVNILADTMMDENGKLNAAITSSFTTGSNSESLTVTYYPATGATAIPLDEDTLTISFTEKVNDIDGMAIDVEDDNTYLKFKAITLLKAGTAMSTSDYTVSLDSKRKKIMIELDDNLALSTTYTVGIKANTLKTESGNIIPASTAVWTSAGTPAVSGMSATAGETTLKFTAKSSVKGTLYAMVLASSATAPVAATVKSATGALASGSTAVTAGGTAELTFSGLKTQTAYKIYAVVYDAQGNVSTVGNLSAMTLSLQLATLTICPEGSPTNVLTGFSAETKTYKAIYVPSGTDAVEVTASPNTDFFAGTLTINGTSSKTATVALASGKATITVILQESGKTAVTYTIEIIETGSVGLDSMTIDGDSYSPGATYTLDTATTESVVLQITPEASDSIVTINGSVIANSTNTTLFLSLTTTSITFVITSADGQNSASYTITFARP